VRLPASLRALRRRDLRLYFAGQTISLVGTWMQSVAQGWLVYRLTGSSELLGLVAFAGQAPVLVLAPFAGALADRLPRRGLALVTQSVALAQAATLAALVLTGRVEVWHLIALATLLGTIMAVDIPTRQAYLTDMAGEDLQNAIALNSTLVNAARMVGPALAGVLVARVGEGPCFLINAATFLPVIAALALARAASTRAARAGRGHLLEGLRYARRTTHARALLLLMALASFAGLPYAVLMPVFARDVLHGGPELLGRLLAVAGLGALVGAAGLLGVEGLPGLGRRVACGSTVFALGLAGLALSDRPLPAGVSLFFAGLGFITQASASNTLLQTLAPPELRGRVMGLYTTAFIGLAPIGGLILGSAAERFGPRAAVLTGAAALLAGSVAFHLRLPALRRRVTAEYPQLFESPGR